MTDNSVDYLNENHKRRLRVNCQEIDRLLAEIETILNASASKSPFPTYRDDLSPVQRKVVQDYIARIRAQMVRVLKGQHIELPMSTVGARQATGQFASTRTACEKLADEIGNFAESAIARAASEVATQWLSGDSQAIDPVSVVKSSLIQVSVEKAQELQGLLKQLAQTLTQVLNDTRDTLDAGNMPVKGELTSSIREMPRLDMGTLTLDLRRPFLLNISKQLAAHQIEKSLQQQIGTTVSEAFWSYQKLLKAWVARTLAELQGQFDSDADTYRAQLERLTGAVGSSQQEKTAIQHDLDELNHWQDTVEVQTSVASRRS
ncbi:hypothetical protein [Nostoc sp.]|uniref:hypothetical protein n=1 Tax=Nostoc sp. TaxID=1180 RepID=UPI002FF7457A